MTLTLHPFGCWYGVLQAIKDGAILYYQAPLDARPARIDICKVFKNEKIRILAGDTVFTADPGHLDRFRYAEVQS